MVLEKKNSVSDCLCMIADVLDRKISELSFQEDSVQKLSSLFLNFLTNYFHVYEFKIFTCDELHPLTLYEEIRAHDRPKHSYASVWEMDGYDTFIYFEAKFEERDDCNLGEIYFQLMEDI